MFAALVAVLCLNGVAHRDLFVQELLAIEGALDAGDYKSAREALGTEVPAISDAGIRERWRDLRAVLLLRAKQPKDNDGWVLQHFTDRLRANKQSARYKAWLAEAQLAAGHPKEALALLDELTSKDLMPDAFAYLVLAKLTTGEPQRAALAACRTRAKVEDICVLPKPKR